MFYLNFLKDKYKTPYICGTPKGENHYHIQFNLNNLQEDRHSDTNEWFLFVEIKKKLYCTISNQ